MKLSFEQRVFSWLDSYDVFDEEENKVYRVKGELSFGHCLKIFDQYGTELGTVQEVPFAIPACFEIYEGESCIGSISKKLFSLFKPQYDIDFNGWHVEGDFFGWDYTIYNKAQKVVAKVYRETLIIDIYSLEINNPADALYVLMFVIALDAEKCSRN